VMVMMGDFAFRGEKRKDEERLTIALEHVDDSVARSQPLSDGH